MSIKDVLEELSLYGGYEDNERNLYDNSDYASGDGYEIAGENYPAFLYELYAVG